MPPRATTSATLIPSLVAALAGLALAVPPLPFPAALELSSLDGDNGFVLNGAVAFDNAGRSVSSAGDVNGDGYDDLIIGAWLANPGGRSDAGESYVVFGGADPVPPFELSTLNGANGFTLRGIDPIAYTGYSVAAAGDVNDDGYGDLIIGAFNANPGGRSAAGASYVVFGGPGPFPAAMELTALNGVNGFTLRGINPNDLSGVSVSAAGDFNSDGYGDLIIGAFSANPGGRSEAGESYVVFGGLGPFPAAMELTALNGANGFTLRGVDTGDNSGASVSAAGDVNDDGYDDIIIGALRASPGGRIEAGESYVVFGGPGPFPAALELSSLNGTNGFVMNGIDPIDQSGTSVSAAGDVSGDGIDDLIIGATGADPGGRSDAGESYVVFGRVGPVPAFLELSALNGSNGFTLRGIVTNDQSGLSVSAAGDVNDDGYGDMIIGAASANPGGRSDAGESYVVFGRVGPVPAFLELSALNGANGFTLRGIDPIDSAGYSVAAAGDVNDDGVDDIIIGAYLASPGGTLQAGESYVVFGRAPVPPPLCPGDVNNDGFTNISDFNILAGNFGTVVTPNTNGDLTVDGLVNISDFNILAGDFGCGN